MKDEVVKEYTYHCVKFGAELLKLSRDTDVLNDFSYAVETDGELYADAMNIGICPWLEDAVFVSLREMINEAIKAHKGRETWEKQYNYVIVRQPSAKK